MSSLPHLVSLLILILAAASLPAAAPPKYDPITLAMLAQLKASPHDPALVMARARWCRNWLMFSDALHDLDKLLTDKPNRSWREGPRKLWLRYVLDYFSHDFAGAEKFFATNPRQWRNHLPWIEEKASNQPEYRQVMALRETLLLRRKETEKDPRATATGLLSLGSVNAPRALIPAQGDPHRKLGFATWAHERYAELLARASAAQRKELETALARQWRQARAKKDVKTMRGVVALVGVKNALGREARLHLARRLETRSYSPEADLLLQQVRKGPDQTSAARAVLQLAEMLTRLGLLEDALAYYRILAGQYPKVTVRPDETGTDVLNNLVVDKRFLPFLDETDPLFTGRFDLRYKEDRTTPPSFAGCLFAHIGEALPFFRQHEVILGSNEMLHVRNRKTGNDRFGVALKPTPFFNKDGWLRLEEPPPPRLPERRPRLVSEPAPKTGNDNPLCRPGYQFQCAGYLTILNLGARVVALNPWAGRFSWEHDTLGLGKAGAQVEAAQFDKDGRLRIEYAQAGSIRLGDPLPLTPTRLCVPTRKGLVALDPATGAVCWLRDDVPQDCRLFSDGQHVFVVRFAPDGKIKETGAYRLRDGAPVRVKDFASLYEKRLRIVDGRLLLWEKDAGKVPSMRLYDVASGKDAWREEFPAGSHPIQSEGPVLTGVVTAKGNVIILEARTKKVVMSGTLDDPKFIAKAKAVRLLADREYFYLAIENPTGESVQGAPRSLFKASAGLRSIPVNGVLSVFKRSTGKLWWYTPVENQTVLVSGSEHLPMVLLGGAVSQRTSSGEELEKRHFIAFCKGNGKVAYANDFLPYGWEVMEVRGSADARTITVRSSQDTVVLMMLPKD